MFNRVLESLNLTWLISQPFLHVMQIHMFVTLDALACNRYVYRTLKLDHDHLPKSTWHCCERPVGKVFPIRSCNRHWRSTHNLLKALNDADSKMLLTGCDDMNAHLYDASGGQIIDSFSGTVNSQIHGSCLFPGLFSHSWIIHAIHCMCLIHAQFIEIPIGNVVRPSWNSCWGLKFWCLLSHKLVQATLLIKLKLNYRKQAMQDSRRSKMTAKKIV